MGFAKKVKRSIESSESVLQSVDRVLAELRVRKTPANQVAICCLEQIQNLLVTDLNSFKAWYKQYQIDREENQPSISWQHKEDIVRSLNRTKSEIMRLSERLRAHRELSCRTAQRFYYTYC